MGTSHVKSNIEGKDGSQTITNFATVEAAAISGTTSVTAPTVTGSTKVVGTGYVQIGTNKYLIPGDGTVTHASIVAVATNLLATNSIGGSLYLGDTQLWFFDSDSTATKV